MWLGQLLPWEAMRWNLIVVDRGTELLLDSSTIKVWVFDDADDIAPRISDRACFDTSADFDDGFVNDGP